MKEKDKKIIRDFIIFLELNLGAALRSKLNNLHSKLLEPHLLEPNKSDGVIKEYKFYSFVYQIYLRVIELLKKKINK